MPSFMVYALKQLKVLSLSEKKNGTLPSCLKFAGTRLANSAPLGQRWSASLEGLKMALSFSR